MLFTLDCLHGSGRSACLTAAIDPRNVMYIFQLFQSGLIFTVLLAGVICVGHVIFVRRKYCRNTRTLYVIMLSGFLHLIANVCMLTIAETYTKGLVYLRPMSTGSCMYYTMTATFANALVCVFIVHNIFVQNFKWSMHTCRAYCGTLGCIITGTYSVIKMMPPNNSLSSAQHSVVTVRKFKSQQVEVFSSICQKNVQDGRWVLLVEYLLIYLPVIVTVLAALCMNRTKQTEVDITELKILSNSECNVPGFKCDCEKMNSVIVTLLIYSAIILLIARPGYILYAHATSGYFRDIMPSLLQGVIFTYICSGYIWKVRSKYRENDIKSSCNCKHTRKLIMHV